MAEILQMQKSEQHSEKVHRLLVSSLAKRTQKIEEIAELLLHQALA